MTPEEIKEMQQRYKNVFGSAEGRSVLGDIVNLGHVFDTIHPEDAAGMAERNLALTILRMSGSLDVLYRQLGLVTKDESTTKGD